MAHQFWRILITGATGGYVGVYALDFQDVNGNSLCVGGTPHASSEYAYYHADRAFPGGDTNWISNGEGGGAWIGYQFANPVDVRRVMLTGVGPCNDRPSQPTTAILQSSDDGANWTNQFETDAPAGGWPYQQAVEYDVPAPPPPAPTAGQYKQGSLVAPVLAGGGAGQINQTALVVVALDLPAASASAHFNMLAFVTVSKEFDTATKSLPIGIKGIWANPLFIQR